MLAAVGHVHGNVTHLPFVITEPVSPLTGQREGLIDMVFFVRSRVGRKDEAVKHPECQNQYKRQLMQRQLTPQGGPDAKENNDTNQSANY